MCSCRVEHHTQLGTRHFNLFTSPNLTSDLSCCAQIGVNTFSRSGSSKILETVVAWSIALFNVTDPFTLNILSL